eukprot:CAMPEP_0181332280 /NCGR_PEP_ID=MMETSP1101-20121128/25002_1 /TAXON_ID=46948 /ORGANISM="Rhodomonas abbreviata, Strain Caron Lab Isolate" /LENGTH=91 /DNA_ID=CAMNT_0023441899 /DNA_START=141 /DNA_END=416 /DNA_ORIENTATION=+
MAVEARLSPERKKKRRVTESAETAASPPFPREEGRPGGQRLAKATRSLAQREPGPDPNLKLGVQLETGLSMSDVPVRNMGSLEPGCVSCSQ